MDKNESCEVRGADERTPQDINLSVYGLTTSDGTDSDHSSEDEHAHIGDVDVVDPLDNLFSLTQDNDDRRGTARFGGSGSIRLSTRFKKDKTPQSKKSKAMKQL